MRVADQPKFSKTVIKNEQHARNHENHLRNLQVVARMNWNGRFEKAHNVVADVADGAADKMRNIGARDKLKAGERLLKLR